MENVGQGDLKLFRNSYNDEQQVIVGREYRAGACSRNPAPCPVYGYQSVWGGVMPTSPDPESYRTIPDILFLLPADHALARLIHSPVNYLTGQPSNAQAYATRARFHSPFPRRARGRQ